MSPAYIFHPLPDELSIAIIAGAVTLSAAVGLLGYRYPTVPYAASFFVLACFVLYMGLVPRLASSECTVVGGSICPPRSWAINAMLGLGFAVSAGIVAIVWTARIATIAYEHLSSRREAGDRA